MATQGYVQLPTDVANTGKKEDHVVLPGGQYREAVVIADPNTDNAYAPVDNTNGLTVNLGANNDVTVTGSVTANAGTDLNTSLLALEAGGNLAGINTNAGTTTDVAVTGDNSGTLSAKLRGLNKILANVWDSVNSRLNVYIQNATLAVTQSGTWNITNVSGTVSLPTGASTAAKQPALGTAGTASADVLTVQGIASMTALKVDGSAVTQPVSGTVTSSNTTGNVANDSADSGNPVKTGGRAVSAEPTPVTAGDRADFITDLTNKQIIAPYTNPENLVSGCISSAMTGTTSTSLVAAPAAGLRNYLTQITVSNTHATVSTNLELQDGNGGTTFYIIPAAAVYGGATISFPAPLRQPTTATAIYIKNSTTGASTFASASGYKGA